MAFTDNLAYGLFAISFAGFMLLYTMVTIYFSYKKGQKNLTESMKSAAIPLFFIGMYLLIMGLWGQFTWPLPGSYNILFYDPMVSFGLVLLMFSVMSRLGGDMEYVGFFALLIGVMVIIYGIQGYSIGLTEAPTALLGLFFLYGFTGIMAYPVAMIAQRKPGMQKNPWGGWVVCIAVFCLAVFVASCLAGYIGFDAIGAHLLTTP